MSHPSTSPSTTEPRTDQLSGQERASAVNNIFERIAPRYDLMNRIMTFGMDQAWRRFVISKAQIPAGGKMLDIATGTGDIAFEAIQRVPNVTAVGADFAPRMMVVGRERPLGKRVQWAAADALNLPYADRSFDAVTHGFLVRNVIDIPRALREQFRVLKSGGHVVCLDTTPPRDNILRPFIALYMTRIIPLIGQLLTGQRDAYTYLPNSSLGFKSPDALASLMREAGFVDVQYKTFNFHTIAIHWGTKPQ
ncbi:MAG: bifunctional demethylmenaquinone methyltransferase/2-methoxy-6-polyprenyl-1,4-benzoquinol methylase UbiE [Anaerolineae bacterium]|nr:bifunctional demethylmenaquinone methyltransferase/2-methoxy-6-polyprenyl-1,4-benzoquinol methylase UbiE [Anaerolineae bacterium]